MKLGGSIAGPCVTPAQWEEALKASRFASVTCPVDHTAPEDTAREYFHAAERLGVVIAEAGVWKNTLSPDDSTRRAAMEYAREQLAFADRWGIPCCVNIAGARGEVWDGAYADNYSAGTYDLIVESVRSILDAVRPARCRYTIEPMPWMMPDGPDEYLQLLRDVDRPMFGVHLDFVNMINTPRRFLFAGDFVRDCLRKLGKYTVSVHAKDIIMEGGYTTILRETAPGKGMLDYADILRSLDTMLDKDTPVLLEHMKTDAEYLKAYGYLEEIAGREGIALR